MEKFNISKLAGRKSAVNSAFGKTNSSHPLQNMGYSLEEVKKLVDNAKKIVGVSFTSTAGTTTPNVQIPATAKYVIGFSFAGNPASTDIFDLLFNNERAIDNGSVSSFQINTGKPQTGFYEFFRPVAGSTSINLNYTSIAGGTAIVFQIIYI